MMSQKRVVAVIPTLGTNIPRLNVCIRSIREHSTTSSLKVVLVNNSLQKNLPNVEPVDEIVFPGLNLGWVGAIEMCRREFQCDYLWTIQDDMYLLNDVAQILMERLEREPLLAVASPVLVRDGVIPARTRAGILTDAVAIEWQNIPEEDIEPNSLGDRADLCFVSGSGAMWRKVAIDDVGGFNLDLFPLMHVDVDICLRLLQAKWNIALDGKAHISHEIGGSTSSILREFLNQFNAEKVRRKLRSVADGPGTHSSAHPEDPRSVVARHSTYFFIDFSAWVSSYFENVTRENQILRSQVAELEAERSGVRSQLEQVIGSKSWRWTHFLRAGLKKWNSLRKHRQNR